MQRPTSISSGVSPSTPLAQRGGITAPLPVDVSSCGNTFNSIPLSNLVKPSLQQDKRREMEYSKIHTLRLMLAQEKKTRDALNASNANHKEDIQKSDAKIKKLQEQLKQVCGEVSDRVWIDGPKDVARTFCILRAEEEERFSWMYLLY